MTTESLDALTKLIEDEVVKVHIDKVYQLDQIKKAFETKESGGVCGKIAIEIKR